MRNGQRSATVTPDDTTPHMNAQIGGNQVTGFSSSRTSRGAGNGVAMAVALDRSMPSKLS